MSLRQRSYLAEKIEPPIRDVKNLIKVNKKIATETKKQIGLLFKAIDKVDSDLRGDVFRDLVSCKAVGRRGRQE